MSKRRAGRNVTLLYYCYCIEAPKSRDSVKATKLNLPMDNNSGLSITDATCTKAQDLTIRVLWKSLQTMMMWENVPWVSEETHNGCKEQTFLTARASSFKVQKTAFVSFLKDTLCVKQGLLIRDKLSLSSARYMGAIGCLHEEGLFQILWYASRHYFRKQLALLALQFVPFRYTET